HWRGIPFESDDRIALRHENDGWHVYYQELGRANREDQRVYDNESDACDDLLMRVARYRRSERSALDALAPLPEPDSGS
ncbi:MAG: hypothetical protein ACOYN3_07610, partial [Acidimicrobiia bacterium]